MKLQYSWCMDTVARTDVVEGCGGVGHTESEKSSLTSGGGGRVVRRKS